MHPDALALQGIAKFNSLRINDSTYARVMKERTTETQSTRRNESLRGFLCKEHGLNKMQNFILYLASLSNISERD